MKGRILASKIVIAALVIVLVALVIKLVLDSRRGEGNPGCELPPPETLNANDVAAFIDSEADAFRIRTTRDVLPGGYSAAMTPLLVDWPRSDISPGGEILLLNVNHGGNPGDDPLGNVHGRSLLSTRKTTTCRHGFASYPPAAQTVVRRRLRSVRPFIEGGASPVPPTKRKEVP